MRVQHEPVQVHYNEQPEYVYYDPPLAHYEPPVTYYEAPAA